MRKVTRNRGPFPNEDAIFKLFHLAIQNVKRRWRAPKEWGSTVVHLDFVFEGRLSA
jgi:putative transposase